MAQTYTLTGGAEIPRLGLGTWFIDEDKAADAVRAAIQGSLKTIGRDYIDLMLIHSPQPWDDFRGGDYTEGNREVQRALEEAHRDGLVRSIGVSNVLRSDLENLLEHSEVDFVICAQSMAALEGLDARDYGEHAAFPVHSGK